MRELLLKFVLQNDLKYGSVNAKSVTSKVLGEDKNLRKKAREVMEEINKVIEETKDWPEEKKKEKLLSIWPEALDEKVVEKKESIEDYIPDFKNTKNVVSIFPPDPSKYPHIGHAKAAFANYGIAKKYGGKFIIRFEDTNPEKFEDKYIQAHKDSYEWLGIKPDKYTFASDYMEQFYEAVKKLLEENKAYVCECDVETMRENKSKKKSCSHREHTVEKNLELWESMKKNAENIVVRMKFDMKHKNGAMRDPTIMRVNSHPHARTGTKYRVWPTYEFENALVDAWEKVTNRIRSKEFETKVEVQNSMRGALGYSNPEYKHIGRLNITGVVSAGRTIRAGIDEGKYEGWDDIRLPTLTALKRRGFDPKGIMKFVLKSGFSKNDGVVDFSILLSEEKKLFDPISKRLFFIENAVEIILPEVNKDYELNLLPDGSKKRVLHISNKVLIPREEFKDGEVRLKDAENIVLKGKNVSIVDKNTSIQKIEWIPPEQAVDVEVLTVGDKDNLLRIKGKIEKNVELLEVGDMVQLERKGYFRLEAKNPFKLILSCK